MTQHIAIKDDIYNELKGLKKFEKESFTQLIKRLIDENKDKEESFTRIINRLIEESREKDKTIENLSKGKEKEFWNKGIIHQT